MPRVATIDEVRAAAAVKAAQKQNEQVPPSPLGVPGLPGLGYVGFTGQALAGAIEWLFVAPTYTEGPDEVWAVVLDQASVTEVDRRHREMNMENGRAGLPKLSTYSAETPYLIVRTV